MNPIDRRPVMSRSYFGDFNRGFLRLRLRSLFQAGAPSVFHPFMRAPRRQLSASIGLFTIS